MESKKTAVFYGRVSDRKQAIQDVSIPSQIERGKEKALQLNADLVRVFVDEGKSGRSDDRREFQSAIEYCELFNPDYLILWSSSRFVRNRFDAALYKRRLEIAGVKWVYISMDVDHSTDSGKMLDAMLEIMDEHKSRETSRDTVRSMISNAKSGYWNGGNPPFGFVPVNVEGNNRRKRLVVEEKESCVVMRIFKLRLSGIGAKNIAVKLNEEGLLRRGVKWNRSSILGILRNEACVGNSIFNRKNRATGKQRPRSDWVIVKSHQAIVDDEMWNATQRLISESASEHPGSALSNHIFTGMMSCHACGGSMQIEKASGRSAKYSYYRCRQSIVGTGCDGRRVRVDIVEPWLVDKISSIIFNAENVMSIIEQSKKHCMKWSDDQEDLKKSVCCEIALLKKKNSNLFSILELHGCEAPNMSDLTGRIRENNEQLQRLESKLAHITAESASFFDVQSYDCEKISSMMHSIMSSGSKDPRKLRAFLGSFVSSVKVFDNHVNIAYLPDMLLNQKRPVHSTVTWLPERGFLGTIEVLVDSPCFFVSRAA